MRKIIILSNAGIAEDDSIVVLSNAERNALRKLLGRLSHNDKKARELTDEECELIESISYGLD